MPEIPGESSRKIEAFCRDLALRHDLDAQTADELRGHLEDKILGYLSGEVKLTEEDALLLTAAHFGDAQKIAGLLGRWVPEPAELAPRQRRLRLAAAATALLMLLGLPACVLAIAGGFRLSLEAAGVFAVFEAGILLSVRADLLSRWQRLTAAGFLLPALGFLGLLLTAAIKESNLAAQPPSQALGLVAALVIGGASFIGHLLVLGLLVLPLRQSGESGIPDLLCMT